MKNRPDRATHGSPELDEDAAKLIALGADPGPTFADLATPPVASDLEDYEAAVCAVGVKHGLNIHPAIARDIAHYLQTLFDARKGSSTPAASDLETALTRLSKAPSIFPLTAEQQAAVDAYTGPEVSGYMTAASDLRERATEFYARQGYDFGPDNIDIIEMLVEFAAAIRAEAESAEWPRRLYDALYAMMYGWADDGTRLEAFAALKEAEPFIASVKPQREG